MTYRYALTRESYADLSGGVLHSAPGFPAFPVRLASEMFQRALAFSPTLGKAIGLAYVAPDQASPGTNFQVRVDSGQMAGKKVKIDLNSYVTCKVVKLPFYDPAGARQEL